MEERGNVLISGSTDSMLLRRAQAEDQEAWNNLVSLYGPLVSYWCRQAGLGDADRADVFQDVFVSVAGHLSGFRRDQSGQSFRGWMRTITRHKIVDHHRRRKKQANGIGGTDAQMRFAELVAPAGIPDDATAQATETRELSRRALEIIRERFEVSSWKAFWRTTIDGVPATEVAEELAMKPEAVRKAKSRVLHRLKEEFGYLLE